jgi:hypothetical protein
MHSYVAPVRSFAALGRLKRGRALHRRRSRRRAIEGTRMRKRPRGADRRLDHLQAKQKQNDAWLWGDPMRSGHARRWGHQLFKPGRSRVNRSQSSRADHGTIHGCPPFLVITLAQWVAYSRRRIARGRNSVPDCNDRRRIVHPGRSLSFVQRRPSFR